MASKEWIQANQDHLNALKREWYCRNRASHKARVQARKRALRQWFREYKAQLRCERCGESHPACLDFHHLDPGQKVMIPSKLANQRRWSVERILTEVAKCEVICANCHRKEHWPEQAMDAEPEAGEES
jgi:hypothetical protein